MPRFSIHSWNDDGTVNEPWMYPEITAQIASLIKQRYRLLPYLYHLLWLSTTRYGRAAADLRRFPRRRTLLRRM